MVRLGKGRLLYVSPDSGGRERKNLTVRVSYDEGTTWSVKRVVESGRSAYADLAMLPDVGILCLYEAGRERPYETLTLGRFNFEWLAEGAE